MINPPTPIRMATIKKKKKQKKISAGEEAEKRELREIFWPHPWHMEVPGALNWIWAAALTYATAAATLDP